MAEVLRVQWHGVTPIPEKLSEHDALGEQLKRHNLSEDIFEEIANLVNGDLGADLAREAGPDFVEYIEKPTSRSQESFEWSRRFMFGNEVESSAILLLPVAAKLARGNETQIAELTAEDWTALALSEKTGYPLHELLDGHTGISWETLNIGEGSSERQEKILHLAAKAIIASDIFTKPRDMFYGEQHATYQVA